MNGSCAPEDLGRIMPVHNIPHNRKTAMQAFLYTVINMHL